MQSRQDYLKKQYTVDLQRTKLLYMNLSSISKFIDEMDKPLDKIGYSRPLQDGRFQVESVTVVWMSDPVLTLRNLYGLCKDFVLLGSLKRNI